MSGESDSALFGLGWCGEMKGLAAAIDDHCIELPGEQLASQATTQRCHITSHRACCLQVPEFHLFILLGYIKERLDNEAALRDQEIV